MEPSNVTQQFAGSFSKVPLHLAKLPLKVLLCEENFRPLLFSVCGQSVSTSMLNNSTKFQGHVNEAGVLRKESFSSEVRTTHLNLSGASELFFRPQIDRFT